MSVPLGRTTFAMFAGIGCVCGGTIVAQKFEPPPPQFATSLTGGSRFDQSTFVGRYKKMFYACNPMMLLTSDDELRRHAKVVAQFRKDHEADAKKMSTLSDEQNRKLWEAKELADSALPNPETGEIIPYPFRMSGYVPFNGPICVAMVASTSTPGLLFWAWANQSQNAMVNYYNRNASSTMTNETLVKSYGTAVTTALTIGFVLATVIKRRFEPAKANQLLKFVAFPSSIMASCLNCYIVRRPEIAAGVPLMNPNTMEDVLPGETSSKAAEKGVIETVLSRAILQVPVYFIPPALVATVFAPLVAANPALSIPLTTFCVLVSFGFGLPFAIAVFPQLGSIEAKDVEEKFRNAKKSEGLTKFTYDKGL